MGKHWGKPPVFKLSYSALPSASGGRPLVLVGNLRSEILVVQSAQNRHRQREADSLDGTRDRRVLVQR